MEFRSEYCSPLGKLTLVSDGRALAGLWMEEWKSVGTGCREWIARDEEAVFVQTRRWLDAYFSGTLPLPPAPPLTLRGTAFEQRVWQQVLRIPFGRAVTYGELAAAMNCASPRAVGAAVGRNPVALIVPCHRVLGAGGKLTGYAGGLARKRWLLAHEGISNWT